MAVVSMKQLLEAGVHFGHQTRRWNPKMATYIYTCLLYTSMQLFPVRRAQISYIGGPPMKHKKWMPRLLAGGLVTGSLMGVALAAAQGTQSDPLVTLSYLNDKMCIRDSPWSSNRKQA